MVLPSNVMSTGKAELSQPTLRRHNLVQRLCLGVKRLCEQFGNSCSAVQFTYTVWYAVTSSASNYDVYTKVVCFRTSINVVSNRSRTLITPLVYFCRLCPLLQSECIRNLWEGKSKTSSPPCVTLTTYFRQNFYVRLWSNSITNSWFTAAINY
jgi:hypothetical protein